MNILHAYHVMQMHGVMQTNTQWMFISLIQNGLKIQNQFLKFVKYETLFITHEIIEGKAFFL